MSTSISPEQIFFVVLGAMFVTGLISTAGIFVWTIAAEIIKSRHARRMRRVAHECALVLAR